MQKILLDTARGGYLCAECERLIGPDEPQLILSDEDSLDAICQTCLKSDILKLW